MHALNRVAWTTPVLGVNGALLYWEPLLRGFAQQCQSFQIFTADFSGNTSATDLAIELCGSYKRLYSNERSARTTRSGYISGLSIVSPALISHLLAYRPDLVILNEFSLLTLYGLFFKALRPGTRILLIVECRPRTTGGTLLHTVRTLMRRITAKSANAVLTNNREGYRYLTEDLHVRPGKIVCKPYLVSSLAPPDTADLRRQQPQGCAPVHFIYVGQLIPRKGVQHALEACALLLERHSGRFVFEIVGDGPYRQELEALSHRLALGDHVMFHGRQPYQNLWEFYHRSEVFLFPTLSDYRSLSPFEALSVGLPILASIHDGGIGETVEAGVNGYAFDPRDAKHLAELMARFIDNPALIPAFSQRSLEMASCYTVPNAVAALTDAANLALKGKGSGQVPK